MKAFLRSTRIAPKKANLVASMLRGLAVGDALLLLSKTNKKAARLFEDLIKSAMANARNNDQQDPDSLVIKTLIVNKAQAYHRGVPMARGRVRRMRKFLSHISLTLGIEGQEEVTQKPAKKEDAGSTSKTVKEGSKTSSEPKKSASTTKKASQAAKKPVKSSSSSTKKATAKKAGTTKKSASKTSASNK